MNFGVCTAAVSLPKCAVYNGTSCSICNAHFDINQGCTLCLLGYFLALNGTNGSEVSLFKTANQTMDLFAQNVTTDITGQDGYPCYTCDYNAISIYNHHACDYYIQ